ncbi:hypothetical protein MBBA_2556 [Methanoculleus bourgensis]|nr:hypothetical protein MBBA_2556 [Methanoculleus bourgensis]
MLWTVVAITPRGVGAGEGARPLPPYGSHARDTMKQSHDSPTRQTWAVFMGNVN